MILHSLNIQPSRPKLFTDTGEELEPFDNRSMRKFDTTVYLDSFVSLPSGQSRDLFRVEKERSDGSNTIRYGPFVFTNLPNGSYKLEIVWESEITDYLDANGDVTSMSNVPTGSFVSNSIGMELN